MACQGWVDQRFPPPGLSDSSAQPGATFDRSTFPLLSVWCCEQHAARSSAFTFPPGSGSFFLSNRDNREGGGRREGGLLLPKNVTTAHLCGWIDKWLPVERVKKKKESERERERLWTGGGNCIAQTVLKHISQPDMSGFTWLIAL